MKGTGIPNGRGVRALIGLSVFCWACAGASGLAQDAAPAERAGPELIKNGSFDEAGDGTKCPFAQWVGRSGQNGAYTFELVLGKTGKAAKVAGTKAGRGDIHTLASFSAQAGATLRVKFWARTENLKGGAFANLEGDPDDNGWHKINIDASKDWKLYEARVVVPKGAKGEDPPKLSLWIYHFGTGDLFIDEVSACVVTPDEAAAARRELEMVGNWARAMFPDAEVGTMSENLKLDLLSKNPSPKPEDVARIRASFLSGIAEREKTGGDFVVGVASSLTQVFLDEPYRGDFAPALKLSLARNEREGAQLVVVSLGKALKEVSVSLAGDLSGPGGAKLPASQVKLNLVGYVDTSKGKRPYQSQKLGWWPDPLLPNAKFEVKPGECQPVLVTVEASEATAPGTYKGELSVACATGKTTLPIEVNVRPFTLPIKGHCAALSLAFEPALIAKFYGGDEGEKIAERFALAAARNRLPPGTLLNGWAWKTPKVPKAGDGYDFAKLDRWIGVLKPYLTRFPLAQVPRFRKFGGGDYDERFKTEFAALIKAYAAHAKEQGIFDAAVLYNIDEASDHPKLREWDACKEMYALSKKAAPGLPVMQCLNEYKGVQALAGHADIWDLYFGQFEQAGGPERLKAGNEITLAVCIWPSEHPNLFVEYPLLDARVMPWICFRTGAKGFEYWDLFQSWNENLENKAWWTSGDGTRTAWKLEKPHGDGLLMYPGPQGEPLSSLRFESLRDGLEDFEYLTLLTERAAKDPGAAALLKEAREVLVTGVTSYDRDPRKMLDLRERIGAALSK
ncbi:MAG: DUF4091 domain-containing protein [Planctomycetota bacterium]|nr:DUF4091 domain-containing protein [Planctomycetota bacterium]